MSPDTEAGAVVEFSGGLPGFEDHRRYVIVRDPAMAPLILVQGLGAGAPSFAAVDPRQFMPSYSLALTPADRTRLRADAGAPLVWLALVSFADDGAATVNLRAPLVINPSALTGIQLIGAPDSETYRFDHPLRAA